MVIDRIDKLHLVFLRRPCTNHHLHSGKMSINTRLTITLCLVVPFLPSTFSQTDYSQYVNPLIGSEGPIPGLASGGG